MPTSTYKTAPNKTEELSGALPYTEDAPKTGEQWYQEYNDLTTEAVLKRLASAQVARVTIADLLPLGNNLNPVPSSSDSATNKFRIQIDKPLGPGARLIKSLAAGIFYSLFPPNSAWFEFRVSAKMRAALGAQSTDLDQQLRQGEQEVLDLMQKHQFDVVGQNVLERLLVEGQVMIHITREGIRYIPFKYFTVRRRNGKLVRAHVCEYIEDKAYLTCIDYESGKVYEVEDESFQKRTIKDKAAQYIVVANKVHPDENFSYGYAYQYLGNLEEINYIRRSLVQLAHIASVALMVVSKESLHTPGSVEQWLKEGVIPGEVDAEGRPVGIGFFTAQTKIAEMSWLDNYVARLENDLMQDFAINLLNSRPIPSNISATQAQLTAEEYDRNLNSHLATLRNTLQVATVKAYMAILGLDQIRAKPSDINPSQYEPYFAGPKENTGEQVIEVYPIGGMSVLTRSDQIKNMQSIAQWLVQNDPQQAYQYLNFLGMAQRAADILQVPTNIMFNQNPTQLTPLQQQQAQAIAGNARANSTQMYQ